MPTIPIDLTNAPDEVKYEVPAIGGPVIVECTSAKQDQIYNNDKSKVWDIVEINMQVSDPERRPGETEKKLRLRSTLWLPTQDDDKQTRDNRLAELKMACKCFGVPFGAGGFNPEDFAGKKGKVDISHRPDKNDKSKMYAEVKPGKGWFVS